MPDRDALDEALDAYDKAKDYYYENRLVFGARESDRALRAIKTARAAVRRLVEQEQLTAIEGAVEAAVRMEAGRRERATVEQGEVLTARVFDEPYMFGIALNITYRPGDRVRVTRLPGKEKG